MTNRDYIAIAKALRDVKPTRHDELDGWRAAVEAVADTLAKENPHGFDRHLFLANCGYVTDVGSS